MPDLEAIKKLLDKKVDRYNHIDFIENDPISIPHRFTLRQDIEIAAFWTAMLAWGQRKTIINKSKFLFSLMDDAPYDFMLHHSEKDLKKFSAFVHRTFNFTDTLYFIHFFRRHYSKYDSLEQAFLCDEYVNEENVEKMLILFHNYFFNSEHAPSRTRKHVPTPSSGSTCKRLNMFLRWMVRSDARGVDFGLWKNIRPDQLICPVDVHVDKVARRLGLIRRTRTDWKTALELTGQLKLMDPDDPVKYDFALFMLGINDAVA